MKRLIALFAALLLLGGAYPACAERGYIPAALRFTQMQMDKEYVRDDQYVQVTYPSTSNIDVNIDLIALINGMANKGAAFLPNAKVEIMSYLDVGSTIFRTGSRWMSFLTIALISHEREQTYVDFDARVYDMESGSRLYLTDIFAPDSAAWEIMAQAVREQLTDYFMNEAPDAAALDALCTREALENAAFTLTPAKLELHYRADALYPFKNTLMHVKLYYSGLRHFMNELGKEVTDNSRYKMIALTYDDGGAKVYTRDLLITLRQYGANATFFIIGNTIGYNRYNVCRQHDAGFAMASHNYEHTYEGITPEAVSKWKAKFDAEMDAAIGVRPAYMRAPGGQSQAFIKGNVGIPLIDWSLNSTDAGSDKAEYVANRVIGSAKDGDVVLMHDLNPLAPVYTAHILESLEEKGFLCVTVDELFDHYGVPLFPNQNYMGCVEEAAR